MRAKSPAIWWISGNLFVTVGAGEGTVKEILKLYGDKFPSTLPRRIDLDKTKWYRAEVEMVLPRLKKFIPVAKLTRIDWFASNFSKLLGAVDLPQFPAGIPRGASVEKKQEIYDAVFAWWQQNKDKVEFSAQVGKLVLEE